MNGVGARPGPPITWEQLTNEPLATVAPKEDELEQTDRPSDDGAEEARLRRLEDKLDRLLAAVDRTTADRGPAGVPVAEHVAATSGRGADGW